MRHIIRHMVLTLTMLGSFVAAPAFAQEGVGFHGGATVDPDQGFFGMHFVTRPLSGDLRLKPGVDLGFGDGFTLATVRFDFANWFELNPRWKLYFGGGPAINIYRLEPVDLGGRSTEAELDLQGGFDTVVGFAHESRTSFEIRIGSNGSPTLRFAVGYTFAP